MKQDIVFEAEIKEVKAKKLVSNDIEYSLRVVTNDQRVIELAKLPPDCTINLSITINT